MTFDIKYMQRALQLAQAGEGRVAPNPMVGAVVVADGRIIGEGFHRSFGCPHAEVNAIASVAEPDRHLLKESTIYVSLEPCSHYGKTPPCAKLIIDTGIPRVVVGAPDPNALVAGRGVRMLREAGIEVVEGVLADESIALNRRFMTAHMLHRPWILLKWAQSADGFMAGVDSEGLPFPIKFSNALSSVWMHRERAMVQAIMVGRHTMEIDRPRLNVRLWAGHSPMKVECPHDANLPKILADLHAAGIHSLMVEGGPTLLQSFIDQDLFDEIRIETAPIALGKGLRTPVLPAPFPREMTATISSCRTNSITTLTASLTPASLSTK